MYFITGSKNKFAEVSSVVPNVEQLDIDLPEIQEIDAHEVIRAKLHSAFQYSGGTFIVEDTSLYLDALEGLPGPLIKWFLKAIGTEGLAVLSEKLGDDKAVARTIIGYAAHEENVQFFEGSIPGKIVRPRGEGGFGWDAIFVPNGHDKTFAEMSQAEKEGVSMRAIAAGKLRDFLSNSRLRATD